MKDETRWTPALIVVALLALLFGRQPTSSAEKSAAGKATRPAAASPSRSEPALDPDVRELLAELGRRAAERDGKLDTLIATVADPIDAHVGWFFDMQVDAIERALEDSGYVLDRFFLPWQLDLDAKDDAKSDTPPRHRRLPGMVLFRSDEKPPLLLLLVGETPTSGVQHDPFVAAACIAAAGRDPCLARWCSQHDSEVASDAALKSLLPSPQIRVLGPSFSGGAASLGALIGELDREGCACGDDRWRVLTGSASAASVTQKELRRSGVSFQATTAPTSVLATRLNEYLQDELPASADQVVWLEEGTTSYGRNAAPPSSTPGPTPTPTPTPTPAATVAAATTRRARARAAKRTSAPTPTPRPACATGPTPTAAACPPPPPAFFRYRIRFPLHIAQARSDYEGSGAKPAETGPASLLAPPSLALNLRESLTPRDVLPPLTPEMTGVEVERVLQEIFQTVTSAEARYVVIVATDPRDLLFLSQQIRERAPNVRLVVFTESFLLFSHPRFREEMEGSIVVSSYPVALDVQLRQCGTQQPCDLRPFVSNMAEGAYNATMLLIGSDQVVDYGWPGPATPERKEAPPVWISVVAHDGLLPVAIYPLGDDCGYVVRRTPAPGATVHPVYPTENGGSAALGWGLRSVRTAWIGLFLCLLFVGEQAWTWRQSWLRRDKALSGGRMGIFQSVWTTGAAWDRWLWAICCVLPLLLVPAIYAWALYAHAFSGSLAVRFLVARVMDIYSGRSLLLLSVLLVALTYVVGFSHLRRSSLLGSGLINPLARDATTTSGSNGANDRAARIAKRTTWLADMIRHPFRSLSSISSLLAMCALLILALDCVPLVFEGGVLDAVLGLWALVASACIVLTALLGVAVWLRLRPVLVLIGYHPVVQTIEALARAGVTVDPRRSLYLRMPALASLQPVVTRWAQLRALSTPEQRARYPEIDGAERAQQLLSRERAEVEHGTGRACSSRTEAECKKLAEKLADALYANDATPASTRWNEKAQEIVALEVAAWIGCIATHVWTLLAGASLAAFLLAIVLTAFPIQPEATLTMAALGIVGAVMIASTSVLVQMERDPVLSRLSQTTQNRIERDWTFLRAVLLYVGLPIASLVAARIPQLSRLFDAALRGIR